MSETGEGDARTLQALRDRIDAIDAAMHGLLIERGSVIAELMAVKGTSRPGAAFRPAREADMMRRLVARHTGALPLTTVEHIWREIITTFTHMQAPFDVAVDASIEPERVHELARFVFGFSVAVTDCEDAAAVVSRVSEGRDLGLVARKAAGAWWRGMARPQAPRIMALLPFIELEGRPANLPAFVISPPLADPAPPEISVFAITSDGRFKRIENCEILARGTATEVLVATPMDQETLAGNLRGAGTEITAIAPVGGFARGIAVDGGETMLYEPLAPAGDGS